MEDGNVAVMARSDDVINVAGHRLSTGALEEVRRDVVQTLTCWLNVSGKKTPSTSQMSRRTETPQKLTWIQGIN